MTTERFGCGKCVPPVPVKIASLGLRPVARLIDESHFGVSISCCRSCGQAFASVFAERIDWIGGEDPQCSTLLPLTPAEAERMTAAGKAVDLGELAALGQVRAFLRDDWPSSGTRSLEYATGRLIGPHD